MRILSGVWLARVRKGLRQDFQERITQHSIVVLFGHVARLLLGIVSSSLLARALGPGGLSIFSVVAAARSIAVTAADLGLSQSATRRIAADLAQVPERALGMAGAYARYKLLAGLVTAGLFLLVGPSLAHWLALAAPARSAFVWVTALSILASVAVAVPTTLVWMRRQFSTLALLQTSNVVLTVAVILVLTAFGRLTLVPALLVGVGTALVTTLLGNALLPHSWRLHDLLRVAVDGGEWRWLFGYGKWLWAATLLSMVAAQADVLLLSRWMPGQAVGHYALAANLASKADLVNQTLHVILMPAISAISGSDTYASSARRSLLRSGLWAVLLLPALPLARPFILLVYGPQYAASIPLFYGLMLTVFFDLFTLPVLLLAYPMDLPRSIAAADATRVAVLVVLGAALIPPWGLNGAVVARLASRIAGAVVLWAAMAPRMRDENSPVALIEPPHDA